jgi:hypothetical protein
MRQTNETSLSTFETEQENGLDSKSNTLRFESHDDALNYVDKLCENNIRWLSINKLDIAHRYIVANLAICVRCSMRGLAKEFHFVFRSIPSGRTHLHTSYNNAAFERQTADNNCGRGDKSVFIGIAEFVQCPENIVPSFVWLEPVDDVDNVLREVFASPFDGILEVDKVWSDRKESVLSLSNSENSLVESGTQIIDNIGSNPVQGYWQGLNELDLMNFLRSVRVNINDVSVWVTISESNPLPFKITKVMLCSLDTIL